MQYSQFQEVWRLHVYVTTRKILLLLFHKGTSYLLYSECFIVIQKFYTVPMCLQTARNFLNHKQIRRIVVPRPATTLTLK